MAKANGDVKLMSYSVHGKENPAFDGFSADTCSNLEDPEDVVIKVTNQYEVGKQLVIVLSFVKYLKLLILIDIIKCLIYASIKPTEKRKF